MVTAALAGSTGLVGRYILHDLSASANISSIHTVSRRPPAAADKLEATVSTDTATWPQALAAKSPPADVFFSALGTTRGAAGSFAAQRAIDYDLNLALATAAQKAGTRTLVLISSGGANAGSYLPYMKMKGELDDIVQTLGFDTTVILRPGLIVGKQPSDRSFGQNVAGRVANTLGAVRAGWKDGWAHDADLIARAAVRSGLLAHAGQAPGKVWMVTTAELVRLGREELDGKA